jgi:hypothetical protein
LRADLIMPETAPFLSELRERAAAFAAHRSVFPSTTRASAASIATGCRRRGTASSATRWRSMRATGSSAARGRARFSRPHTARDGPTLHVPTLGRAIALAWREFGLLRQCLAGRGLFPRPDGHGLGTSFGPAASARVAVASEDPQAPVSTKGIAGDRAMTERFCSDVLEERAPSSRSCGCPSPTIPAIMRRSARPQHLAAIAGADTLVKAGFRDRCGGSTRPARTSSL